MMDLSIPYYEDLTRLSNSNIGWFLNKGPAYLHKMLSGQGEEEKSVALTKGTMIHEYLLQPEEFQKDYRPSLQLIFEDILKNRHVYIYSQKNPKKTMQSGIKVDQLLQKKNCSVRHQQIALKQNQIKPF